MKDQLENNLKTLDLLNSELEDIKNYLLQNSLSKSSASSQEIVSLQEENMILKQQNLNYKKFLSTILESLDSITTTIEELKNNE
ncbi:MAG: hypothetical protein LBH40_04725 [Alphaproteobacteria bacterium]|nr:hypothetical protein [Alphaproteobacteria bacterium]